MTRIIRVLSYEPIVGAAKPNPLERVIDRAQKFAAAQASALSARGRAHWTRFHTMELTPETLAAWEAEIPSYGCNCKAKYSKIKEANPPRFDDPDRWRWEIHNAVNESLDKIQITFEEANAIWSSHGRT